MGGGARCRVPTWVERAKNNTVLKKIELTFRKFHNLGEEVGDKLSKLSKIGFEWSRELTFGNFLPKNVKIWLLVGRLGTRHQNPSISGIFLEIS